MLYELGKEDGAMQQDVMTHVLGTAYGGTHSKYLVLITLTHRDAAGAVDTVSPS